MEADSVSVVHEVVPPTAGVSEGLLAQRNSISRTLRDISRVVGREHWKVVVFEPHGGVHIHLKTEGDGAITTSSRTRRDNATRTKAKRKGKEVPAALTTSMLRELKKRRWRLKGLAGQILRRRYFKIWAESISISELIKATSLLSTTRTTRSSKCT
jgi:hypothetical protein